MTLKYEHLLHLDFVHGSRDCYELMRDFYRDNFDLDLPSYARPDDWWSNGMDLYRDHFHECGFRVIDPAPHEIQVGDAFLFAIQSQVPNHAAAYVGDNKIIHHFIGARSEVIEFSGAWRNRLCATLRHVSLKDWKAPEQRVGYEELLRERAAGLLPRGL